jgi:hypothetical protein
MGNFSTRMNELTPEEVLDFEDGLHLNQKSSCFTK